jgi:hypothetical protein
MNSSTLKSIVCVIFVLMAAASSDTDRSKELAAKYDMSQEDVAHCMSLFEGEAEKALDVVKSESMLFGLIGPDCDSLAKEAAAFQKPADFFEARKLDLTKDAYYERVAKEAEKLAEQKRQEFLALKKKVAEAEKITAARVDELITALGSEEAFRAAVEKAKESKESLESYVENVAYVASCKENYRTCKDNTDVADINTSVHIDGKSACKAAAEKAAQWDVDWGGWLEPNFGSYITGTSARDEGYVTLIDEVAKYQNGFGAWRRATTRCMYMVDEKQALIVSVD